MKIRRGFVTNSSSTNFGVMVITSLASVSAASFLSIWDNIFGVDKSKKKDYVRLCIEAPSDRILKLGESSYIKAMLVKASIIDGKFQNTLENAGTAKIELIKGNEFMNSIEGEGGENVTFTITEDKKALTSSSQKVIFNVSGENMSQKVEFYVPMCEVEPEMHVFFAGEGTKNEVKVKANLKCGFNKFYKGCKLIEGEVLQESQGEFSESSYLLTECMTEEQIEKHFGKSKAKIDNKFKICGTALMEDYPTYTARIVRECIIIPQKVKEPFELKAYSESEKEKQEKNAFLLAIKVMKYNEEKKDVYCDIELTNNLQFDFAADNNVKDISLEKAEEIVENSSIIAELEPNNGEATESKPYATYRIYPSKLIESDVDTVDLNVTVSCDDIDIEDLTLKAQLKPDVNYKAMIKWFIEYPQGTYIDKYVKLGDFNKYWGAIDFIKNRVIEHSKASAPRSQENHYEDGKLDATRSPSVILRKESMPKQLGDFTEIQSLYHELTHTIEDQNGDIGLFEGFVKNPGAERHAYFVQHLSNATKHLADLERNFTPEIDRHIFMAISSYGDVYFNQSNIQPIDYFQDFDWFGAKTPTQHNVFAKYAMLDVLYDGSLLTSEQTEIIARGFRKFYFPGSINGSFVVNDGFFKGAEWNIRWSLGALSVINITFPGYTFTEKSREWQGGSTLALRIVYDIQTDDGKTDTLIAYLDAGTFDAFDYHYPKVTEFNLTWKPTLKISDCIIGSDINKTVKLVRQ